MLEREIELIYRSLVNHEFLARQISEGVHPSNRLSALNLIRYITLRNHDLRKIHDTLSEHGISSLRSGEAYTLHNIISVLKNVKMLNGKSWTPHPPLEVIGYKRSKKIINRRSHKLFNRTDRKSKTEIMVTMPTEAATNSELVRDLIAEGMEIARINLSHDDQSIWKKMVENIRTESSALGIPCKIHMDLSGPKIRTGSIQKISKKGKVKNFIKVKRGTHIILMTKSKSTKPVYGEKGELITPAKIPVSLPLIIQDAQVGERILFDDGKIVGQIIRKKGKEMEVVIKRTPKEETKLKSEKGINLPDTNLNLPALTTNDLANLDFVVEHADLIGYSFVRTPEDVKLLLTELENRQANEIGVILKIENEAAFNNLPIMLLEAMKHEKVGVMIARGDLAAEIGAERIAEVQDQIMWISEAAHVPVIWATQVLENLSKTGIPSRAEITDAAKSARAECVMLNKGDYILQSVAMLRRILTRMEDHTSKKKSQMRPLNVAKETLAGMENYLTTEMI